MIKTAFPLAASTLVILPASISWAVEAEPPTREAFFSPAVAVAPSAQWADKATTPTSEVSFPPATMLNLAVTRATEATPLDRETTLSPSVVNLLVNTDYLAQSITDDDNQTEAELRQRVQELEQRQQELEQEIDALRQLIEQQTVEEPAEEPTPAIAEEATPDSLQALEFSAEALFLRPRTSNLQDYAIVDPGSALFVGGDVAAPEFDQSTGGRFQLTYHWPDTPIEVSASYTTFNSSGSSSVERPPNGFLLATLAAPVQNENADQASSTINLDYDVTDVDVAYNLPSNSSLQTQLFGGLRFASITQTNDVFYNGRDFTNGTVNVDRYFSGFGLRVGGEVALDLGSDFSIFGRAAGSLLVSSITTNQQETDNNGADLIVNLNRTAKGRIVPVVELATGLQWQPMVAENLNLNFAVGYEFQNWFNIADTTRFVDSSGTGVITQDSGDLSLNGFFLQLGLLFRF